MRQKVLVVLLVIGISAVLGATVLREPIAAATTAATTPFQNVIVSNIPDKPVPVKQQGTVDVNVTNGSLDVAASTPVTGGGGEDFTASGVTKTLSDPGVASALQLNFVNGATKVGLSYQGAVVAFFFKNDNGNTIEPPLTRPIKFDSIGCSGTSGGICLVEWV